MRTKFLMLTISMMLVTLASKAQFNHAVGASLLFGVGELPKGAPVEAERPTIIGYGIFYHPRYNVSETESGAISVGIPLTLGLNGTVNSREGGSLSFTADLPLTVDYHVGAASTVDNESGFGAFIGAGFGYTYTNYSETYSWGTDELRGRSFGPLVHGGIKLMINERVYFLRASFKYGLETEKYKTFGVSAGITL